MIYSILWLYRSNSGRSATLLYAYSSPERSNTLELKHLVYFVSYLTCPVCPSLYVFVLSISCEKSVASPCLVSVSLFSSVNLVCLSPCPNVPALLWQSLISLDSVHLFPQMCSLCPNLLVYLNPISFLFFVVSSLAVCLLEDLKVWLDYLFLAFILFVL